MDYRNDHIELTLINWASGLWLRWNYLIMSNF